MEIEEKEKNDLGREEKRRREGGGMAKIWRKRNRKEKNRWTVIIRGGGVW